LCTFANQLAGAIVDADAVRPDHSIKSSNFFKPESTGNVGPAHNWKGFYENV
jgi:hypothetical protein